MAQELNAIYVDVDSPMGLLAEAGAGGIAGYPMSMGLWHDPGKVQPDFQSYIRGLIKDGPPHAWVGAAARSYNVQGADAVGVRDRRASLWEWGTLNEKFFQKALEFSCSGLSRGVAWVTWDWGIRFNSRLRDRGRCLPGRRPGASLLASGQAAAQENRCING